MKSALPAPRQSALAHFITCIVAVLVFISGIAVTAAGSIGGLVEDWNSSVTGTLTIQIPGTAADSDKAALAARDAVLSVTGVKRVDIVPRAQSRDLLKPWLGDPQLIADLPLPALLDVELETPSALVIEQVSTAAKTAAPDAITDDHRVWLNRIAEFASALSYIAFALIGLSLGALTLIVVFATRASMTEYTQVIEVLHLVGARDAYISAQFSWRALTQAFWGGLIGMIVFIPVFVALSWFARRIDPGILPALNLPTAYWAALALLPVAAALISYGVARATVSRALADMV